MKKIDFLSLPTSLLDKMVTDLSDSDFKLIFEIVGEINKGTTLNYTDFYKSNDTFNFHLDLVMSQFYRNANYYASKRSSKETMQKETERKAIQTFTLGKELFKEMQRQNLNSSINFMED